MAFNIFLIITLLTSLQPLLLHISDIFMVFILPVKVSFLICPLCSRYYGEYAAIGPALGWRWYRVQKAVFCSPLSLYLYWCVHHNNINNQEFGCQAIRPRVRCRI